MKIAITGATGFIGCHLVEYLSKTNHEILCVSRNKAKLHRLAKRYNIQYRCDDITNDTGNWFKKLGVPDAVIHLAWDDLNNYTNLNHLKQHLPNHLAFVDNLINNGLGKLVVAGTCFEYGLQTGALKETYSTDPVTPYGTAKDTLRKYLSFLQSEHSFSLVWLRYFYMHGAGQSKTSFFSQLECAIAENKPVFKMSAGEQLRDYLPVEEITFLTTALTCDAIASGVYNICSGQPVSLRRLAEQIITEKKSPITLKLGHYPYPEHEPMAFWGNRSKLNGFLKNRKLNEE